MDELLERLSELEHVQWQNWSKSVSGDLKRLIELCDKFSDNLNDEEKEFINSQKERLIRWEGMWIPYDELSEDLKELDRNYARKIMDEL
ncbi:hypothetical protein [uncultured Methanobrevibacter sp.]|uniref:hypothetical protein n=1 Tax=uncultured Methanobrevibacter sp. TaxID=253161 RepID=UPI0025D52869|nr:hypothetical protein [uncultured Methanobrevibacter sp.]